MRKIRLLAIQVANISSAAMEQLQKKQNILLVYDRIYVKICIQMDKYMIKQHLKFKWINMNKCRQIRVQR